MLARWKTGACFLSEYAHKIGKSKSPNCEICGVPESIDHFIWHCPEFEEERQKLAKNAKDLDIVNFILATNTI